MNCDLAALQFLFYSETWAVAAQWWSRPQHRRRI